MTQTLQLDAVEEMLGELMDAHDHCIDSDFSEKSVAAFRTVHDRLAGEAEPEDEAFLAELEQQVEKGARAARDGTLASRTSIPLARNGTDLGELDGIFGALPPGFVEGSTATEGSVTGSRFKLPPNFIKKILEKLSRLRDREKDLLAQQGEKLPVRNSALDLPGYVEPFREMDGLIHGGVVRKPGYVLVCRAFRFFEWKRRKISPKGRYPGDENIEVVAGICEKRSLDGRVLSTWSTALRLGKYYASASMALPSHAARSEKLTDGTFRQSGFYYPFGHIFDVLDHVKDRSQAWSRPVDTADTGVPMYTAYRPSSDQKLLEYAFVRSPSYKDAVENALFSRGVQASERFPINTPYLKVYSPSPQSPTTIVAMVGAYRHWRRTGSRAFEHKRGDRWYVRRFR